MNTRNDAGRHAPDADPRTTEMLRQHYTAPQADAYWHGMEERIMHRISNAMQDAVRRPRWWSGFAEFRPADLQTAGLIAATLALLAAGATFVRDQSVDAKARELAARAAVEAAMPLPLDDVILTRARQQLAPDAPERYLNPLDY